MFMQLITIVYALDICIDTILLLLMKKLKTMKMSNNHTKFHQNQ